MLEAGTRKARLAFGIHSMNHAKNMLCSILTFGQHQEVFPQSRHFPVRKDSGETSHIKRFNLTPRHRVSRLGRKTLFFSKI